MRQVIDLAPTLTGGLALEAELAPAGAAVAGRLAAAAATLTHGFAGAVLLAALAVRGRGRGRQALFLAAHDIEIAGPLRGLLAAAGVEPVAVGSVDQGSAADLQAALGPATAACLYVADSRLAAARLVGFPAFRHAAHAQGVATVVLAPTGECSEGLLDAGADLLVLDATTALAGPALGILAGRPELVAAARAAQASGLGRLTRPAPDLLAALLAALGDDPIPRVHARRARLAERLAGRPGLRLLPARDGAVLHVDAPAAGFAAPDLAHALAQGRPALLVDHRDAASGRLGLDLARLDDASFEAVVETVCGRLAGPLPAAPWP